MDSLQIDLDLVLDVEYRVVENPRSGRLYPIDIVSVMHRGKDIYSSLHVDHVLTLQRRVYLRLVDDPHSGLLVK